ncbi:MAG: hypothetical protein J6N49_03935 [Alphaproteobacteria bacterium]|nr:hypothetical protein [Alphaproteobacteria bacterium]
MPKYGLKCFLGSFLLSLAAVFVATKAYLVMSLKDKAAEEIANTDIETKNIELFASNEDTDPLYEKFNNLQHSSAAERRDTKMSSNALDLDEIAADAPLSEPVEEDLADENNLIVADDDSDIKDIIPSEEEDDDMLIVAANEVTTDEPTPETNATSETTDELVIADASTAPVFSIPLIHNYDTGTADVSVSNEADNSQIALSSHNVAVGNLGTQNRAAVTDTAVSIGNSKTVAISDADSPWDVAETANKHAGKNSLGAYTKNTEASGQSNQNSSGEKHVAYKMQKNLLIPIPDEIMNDKNLTPQFSTSAENKKLEDELRAKKTLPALDSHGDEDFSPSATNEDNSAVSTETAPVSVDKDAPELLDTSDSSEESQSSRSLSESIAAWFSSSKPKSSDDNIKAPDKSSSSSRSNGDQSNSIFNKLLGAKKSNVTPTELKLSFQPNRAEISGQTLEWIHAFADNAVKYENVVVEIRINKSAPYELQQKRLRLLYRILANNGVEFNKINIIFTEREPNSFIIRNVRYATEEEKAKNVKTYNPWS